MTIPNLAYDQPYFVYLRAVNARGNSVAEVSSYSVTLVRKISVSPDKIYRNTPATITYSNDDVALTSIGGITYSLYYNDIEVSSVTPSSITNTYVFNNVSIPTIDVVELTIKNNLTFTSLATFKIPVLYENPLSFDAVSINASGEIIISGLTNGLKYTLFITAETGYGDNVTYSYAAATPYTIPDAPTSVFLVSLPGKSPFRLFLRHMMEETQSQITNTL